MTGRRLRSLATRIVGTAVLVAFVLAPLLGVAGSAVTASPFWEFPPRDLSLTWFRRFLDSDELVGSVRTSIVVAVVAGLLSTVVALMGALYLSRGTRSIRHPARVLYLAPLIFPHLTLGLGIYMLYNRARIDITPVMLAFAQLIVILPIILGLLLVALDGVPATAERAAASLGASRFVVLRRVTFPLIKPAIVTAAVMAFIASFDDAAIALFVRSPDTVTLPVRMLVFMDAEPGPLIAAAGCTLMVIAVAIAVIVDRTIGLSRAFSVDPSAGRRRLAAAPAAADDPSVVVDGAA